MGEINSIISKELHIYVSLICLYNNTYQYGEYGKLEYNRREC
jgi:hypothetical protein